MNIFEILVVLIVALVVLGPERLPEVLRTLGKILRELRSASNDILRELTDAIEDQPRRLKPEDPGPAEPRAGRQETAPPPGQV